MCLGAAGEGAAQPLGQMLELPLLPSLIEGRAARPLREMRGLPALSADQQTRRLLQFEAQVWRVALGLP